MNALHFYSILDKLPVRRNFASKVLLVTLAGAFFPALVFVALQVAGASSAPPAVTWVVMTASFGTAGVVMAWAVKCLSEPVEQLAQFVDGYLKTGQIGNIPDGPQDDLGALMRNTRTSLLRLDQSAKQLEEASSIDVLTGLQNRRFSSKRIHSDIARAGRSHMPLSLVVADIDEFTNLNQKFGTAVGDVCLQHFAELATACIREGDWIARWGGDEFMILLWNADSKAAVEVIDRIRIKLASSASAMEAGIRLSASFGHATHLPGELEYELFAKADSALHRAKKRGRNHVAVAASGKN